MGVETKLGSVRGRGQKSGAEDGAQAEGGRAQGHRMWSVGE